MSVSYRNQALKWQPDKGNDLVFIVINSLVFIIVLSVAVYLSSIELPKVERKSRVAVPERVAQLILRKEKTEPQIKKKPESELKQKLEKKEKPKPKVKRKLKKPKINKSLTKKQKKTIEIAKQSGLLALSNELADLMDTSEVGAMVRGEINKGSGAEKIASLNTEVLTAKHNTTGSVASISGSKFSSSISTTKLSRQERIKIAQTLLLAEGSDEGSKNTNSKKGSTAVSANFRSDEDIAFVMDKNKGKLYRVYRQARRVNPGLKGRIVFEVTILPSGKVSKVEIKSSELDDPKLESRLLARVKTFNFGEREGGAVTISYPIEFLPF